jgi:hypothetical protein
MTIKTYTDEQATDEAVLLLTRKLHRLYPDVHAALMAKLPESAREALHFAEMHADTLRAYDKRDGITREYVSRFADLDDEGEDDADLAVDVAGS